MNTKTLTINPSYQYVVRSMIAILILLFGLYVYFVASIVVNAASRTQDLSQAEELASAVSTLEAQYVNLSGKITMDSAYGLGFVEVGGRSGLALAHPDLTSNN